MSDQTTRLLLDQAQREIVKLESRLREAENHYPSALRACEAERDRLRKERDDLLAGKCLDCAYNPGLCDTHGTSDE